METPLLLLHGFCESPQIFDSLNTSLSGKHQVLCPCLPGHGELPWNTHLKTMDDLAFWLRDYLDAAAVTRVTLIGHSLGGYIAAAFAAHFPDRLAGLGMLHSTALADLPERQLNRNKALAFIEQNGHTLFLQTFVQSLFYNPEAAWLAELTAITQQVDPPAISALLGIMRDRPERTLALQTLQIPVMYIIGAHDSIVSPERAREEMAKIALALLHRIPDASHMGMYETPHKVRAAIESFLELC
ncbi:MAG TPA: alpha/beta hydrolase [Bacteroidetes bacterium]|nr:alpha/beta hydrolase [Bacteroidota bacterium]